MRYSLVARTVPNAASVSTNRWASDDTGLSEFRIRSPIGECTPADFSQGYARRSRWSSGQREGAVRTIEVQASANLLRLWRRFAAGREPYGFRGAGDRIIEQTVRGLRSGQGV